MPDERDSDNIRNGTRPKPVLTEATGQVQIDVLGTATAPSSRRSPNGDPGSPGS